MELGIVVVLVAVAIWYGVLNSLETVSRMGNKELTKLEDEQTLRHDEWYKSASVAYTEDESKAIDNARTYFKSRRK